MFISASSRCKDKVGMTRNDAFDEYESNIFEISIVRRTSEQGCEKSSNKQFIALISRSYSPSSDSHQ